MQDSNPPKVTLVNHNKIEIIDDFGRIIVLEEPSALEFLDFLICMDQQGTEDKGNKIMANTISLICIKSIDGIPVKKPQTKSELRAIVQNVKSLKLMLQIARAVGSSGLLPMVETEEKKEEIKNS